jgi:hypothetical protein
MTQPLKTAILLTGAAARISQEVALFDQLQASEEIKLTVSQDDTLLAGFSSGSLNLAAINACFSTGSTLDWETYYKQTVLFPLRNKNVFKIDFSICEKIINWFKSGFKIKLLPLDTSPLRETITEFVNNMHCEKVGDLPFYSFIPTFSLTSPVNTLWASNQSDEQFYLNLTDMFMASTAIPVLFPSQEINCEDGQPRNFPDGMFADGGTGGTFANFDTYIGNYVRENGQLDTLYVISPMREKAVKEIEAVMSVLINKNMLNTDLDRLEAHLENFSMNAFLKFLNKLNDWRNNDLPIAKAIFVCIPEMAKNFFILNFNDQKRQYNAVKQWVNDNPAKLAIPLQHFLDTHPVEMD